MSQVDFGLQPVVSPAPQRSVPPRELRDLRDLASIDLVRTASTLPASPIDRDTQVQSFACLCPSLPSECHTSLSHPGAGGCRQLAEKTFAALQPVVQEEKVMAVSSILLVLRAGMGGQSAADSTQGKCAAGQAQGWQPGELHHHWPAYAAAGAGHEPPECW